jgi:hypothetical protein
LAGVKAARRDNDTLKAHNSLIGHSFDSKIEPGGDAQADSTTHIQQSKSPKIGIFVVY